MTRLSETIWKIY